VAGCTGSRLRRLTVLAVAWIAAGSAIARAPPPANTAAAPTPLASPRDADKTQGQHAKNMDKSTKVETHPDAALIEYLGEYDDAADGLDPMGLTDPEVAPSKSGDGHG
jgi:hypothetical protein